MILPQRTLWCSAISSGLRYAPANRVAREALGHANLRSVYPLSGVPGVELLNKRRLSQSSAILEDPDGRYPEPPFVPAHRVQAAPPHIQPDCPCPA